MQPDPEPATDHASRPEPPSAGSPVLRFAAFAVGAGLFGMAVGSLWIYLSVPDEPAVEIDKRAVAEAPAPRPPSPVFDDDRGGDDAPVDRTRVTPGFVRIEPGRFAMGSHGLEPKRSPDEFQHDVRISYAFELQATEVTQREYEALIGRNPSYSPECGPDCPVEQVSWFEAVHYCNELSRRRKLPVCVTLAGKVATFKGVLCGGFRLPTEAEWEYAARAGSDKARYGELGAIAWYDLNSQMKPHPVARKRPNAWGLFDMIGNVFEWVWDWKDDYPKHLVADPTGPPTGDNKVFRGGAYRWTDAEARAAFRNAYGPLNKVEFIGFRCARTLR